MKILITHTKPHLDDICAVWLFKKYSPEWKKAQIKFVPISSVGGSTYDGKPVDSNPNLLHIGVCRGRFDEHKGDIGEAAVTLVHKFLQKQKSLPKDKITKEALRLLVEYVREGDLGKRLGKVDWQYEFATLVMWIPDSCERIRTGFVLLEASLDLFKDMVALQKDWKHKKVFNTKWGKGVGINSRERGTIRAYTEGFKLIAQVDPKSGYRSIRAHANSKVDLTKVYETLKKLEPNADWYLHHSKKLLICGSEVAPKVKLSRLTLDQLIGLVKE